MQDISSRGVESNIDFIPNSNTPDAYSLKGSYEVSGDTINVSVNIWQNKKNIYRYLVKRNKNKMKELTSEIVKEAEEWVNKQK